MSGEKAQYSPEEIAKIKQKLESTHENAGEIIKLAADANPEWYIWGLVGAIPAVFYWKLAAEDVYEHLNMMGEGLKDKVMRLDSAGKAYKESEQVMSDALKKIKDILA